MRALGYFRRTADECDTERKARHEPVAVDHVNGPEAITRRFVAHLDEQAAAIADLVEGRA